MENTQIKKLNSALYKNHCCINPDPIKDIIDKDGFPVVQLSAKNQITGKMTMFFNGIFGAGNYSIQY